MSKDRYELIVFERFAGKDGAKAKYRPHRVGNAVKGKEGNFTLFIPPGVSISGRVLMVPIAAKAKDADLIAAYRSAAEEYGL